MSEENSTDILKPVPLEEWSLFQEKTKSQWPLYAYLYYWVQNAIRWKKSHPDIKIQLYSPNGDQTSGTFIGISEFALYNVIVFTLEPKCETLKKVITETGYLDWPKGIHFAGTHERFIPAMLSTLELLKNKWNFEISPLYPAVYHFKDAEECGKAEIQIPDEYYLKTLNETHIPQIHSEWPHKDTQRPDLTTRYLMTMVKMNGGIGLFLKQDDSLVSWALHTDWDGMGMVQTIEQHKRKGYAKIVINSLSKKLAKQGTSTTLFVIKGNTASETLFRSLGYKTISPMSWIILKRDSKNRNTNTQ